MSNYYQQKALYCYNTELYHLSVQLLLWLFKHTIDKKHMELKVTPLCYVDHEYYISRLSVNKDANLTIHVALKDTVIPYALWQT